MAGIEDQSDDELPLSRTSARSRRRSAASYERELAKLRSTESGLREALAGDEALLRQKDALIEQLRVLGEESDHRLLNGLQLIASLISLQSRAATNADTAAQLAAAAERVAMIVRVHRRLHCLDGAQIVAFKPFLKDLCGDFFAMLSSEQRPDQSIMVEGDEVDLPAVTAIPLGYIVNELVTNAAKYGSGQITVRLVRKGGKGNALSVSNDGPTLPDGFDPATSKGLGMKIVRAFVARIDGELRISRGDRN
jgi:two-component system, sensor histidine kinase PdtaS